MLMESGGSGIYVSSSKLQIIRYYKQILKRDKYMWLNTVRII